MFRKRNAILLVLILTTNIALAKGLNPDTLVAIEHCINTEADPIIRSALAAQVLDEEGITPLMRAIRDREHDEVKALLKKGVDINAKDSRGRTALIYAMRNGTSSIVNSLIKNGIDVNAKDENGQTALMSASLIGNASFIKTLLGHGADVNAKNNDGATALTLAARAGRANIIELLKKAGGVDPNPEQKASPSAPKSTVDSRPVLLNRLEPSYTVKALEKGVQGIVVLRVLIGNDGIIKKMTVIRGLSCGLTYQAVYAASQLRFMPAIKDGQPVAYSLLVEVEFNIRRRISYTGSSPITIINW